MPSQPLQTSLDGSVAEIPPPMDGLDESVPIMAQRPTHALRLRNMVKVDAGMAVRLGTQTWASGLGNVEAMITWGDEKLFACHGGNITEIRRGLTIPHRLGFLSNRWLADTVPNPGGRFMVAANGLDPVQVYTGSTWLAAPITGVQPSRLASPTFYNRRIWFYEVDTLDLWYLDPGAFGGEATIMPLSGLFKRGGRIVGLSASTSDGGSNSNDTIACVTDKGEMAIFSGIDPDNSETWQTIGVFALAQPLGWRPFGQIGGRLAILTKDGLFDVPGALPVDKGSRRSSPTNLSRAVGSSYGIEAYFARDPRWQLIDTEAEEGMLVVNRPSGGQFIRSAKAWSTLADLDVTCWGQLPGRTFFGTATGEVKEYGIGYDDDGRAISALCVHAYTRPGSGKLVTISRARPNMLSLPTRPMIRFVANYDEPADHYPAPELPAGVEWDFPWTGPERPWQHPKLRTRYDWRLVEGRGNAVAAIFAVKTRGPLLYRGISYLHKAGAQV